MINKTYKIIHNKYSFLFKFIFFLRYLFGIFFISGVLFLIIPHLFDLKKKDSVIKDHLSERYGLRLNKYEKITYNSLPVPNLEIQNADVSMEQDILQMNISSLKIYPKLINIYNYKDYEIKKIILNENKILLEDSSLKILIDYIFNLKSKIAFKNLNLKINKKNIHLVNLEKINISNYGYKKNIIIGEVFNKKFKILVSDDHNKVNFKLIKTGITADINFNEIGKDSLLKGVFKSKLLNTNLKFNFDYNDKKLKIYNSYFRSKNLSFNNKSTIVYQPYFYLNSIFDIDDINIKFLKEININKILNAKELIKKINIKNKINFKSKKLSNNLIDNLNLNIDIAYGRLVYSKKILIKENSFTCKGDINLLAENSILYFDCSIISNDKKKFLKEFAINYKNRDEIFELNAKGNINILKNKINFKQITMNQDYKASKEDLRYFKQIFEIILLKNNFLNIFNSKKIREFILEIF
jgi:hypothetical protein